jgi:hypothetical protein
MGHPQISLWRNLETLHEAGLADKHHYSRQEVGYRANIARLGKISLFLRELIYAAIRSPAFEVTIDELASVGQGELTEAWGMGKQAEGKE